MGVIKSNLGVTEMLKGESIVSEEEIVEEEITEEEIKEVIEEEEVVEETEEKDEETVIDYKSLWEAEKEKSDKLLDKVTQVVEKPVESTEQHLTPAATIAFLNGEDLEEDAFLETISDKGKFVNFLNDFGNSIRIKTSEEILQTVPGIAQGIASFTINMNDMNREFFTDNPELLPMKKLVAATADELIKEGKVNDLDGYQKILKDLPGVLEKRLGINLKDLKKETVVKKKPSGQVKPGGTRVSKKSLKENLTPLEKDIAKAIAFSKKNR